MWCAADVLVGTSFCSQSLSLSQSLTLRISPLSFRFLTLSLWVPFSLSDTLHCRTILTFPSLDSVPLSLSISLTHTQNDTATGKSMEKRTKNPPSFFYIRNNAPLLQQNAKRIEIGMD